MLTYLWRIRMDKIQGEKARRINKSYYGHCKAALDNGYYLEAIVFEYAYLENRVNRIMELLEMPCACADKMITKDIGLSTKLKCLKMIVESGDPIFEKSKLKGPDIRRMRDYCESRNTRIHRLYADVDRYFEIMERSKKIAEEGYEYTKMISTESTRIKNLKAKNPELFENKTFICEGSEPNEKTKKLCIKAYESLNNK